MKKGQKKRIWTPEQKAQIVHKHLDEHVSVRTLEKEFTADRSMICRWVKEYLAEGEQAFIPKGRPGNRFAALHTSKSLSEVERLRLMVAKLEIENARLKKDIGWKELVQTRSTLLETARLRNYRRTPSKVPGRLSVPYHGHQSFRLLQMESQKRAAE